jgi:CBS domain containing-hemolysin-like protein
MERVIFIVLVIGFCAVLSFLFSGMEAGVLALSRLRIRQLVRAGNPNAVALNEYLERPENFLWTILIGNTLANFAVVGLAAMVLHDSLIKWPWAQGAGFVAVMFLVYAFCELLPKMLFRMFPNRLCLALANPFGLIHLLLSPLVLVMTKLSRGLLHWSGGKTFTGNLFGSREEMRLFMQESAQGLTSEERQMINRVLDLQNSTVRNLMVPMAKATTVTAHTPMSEALKVARERKLTRLPVWRGEGEGRRIAGIVSLRALLFRADLDLNRAAGEYVKPALYLEEETHLEAALKRMQRSGQRMAIVLGRDQREVGILSLHDIFTVIFGEVRL